MYCWTHRPKPSAPAATPRPACDPVDPRERVRRQASRPRQRDVPAIKLITISALPVRLQKTSDGGPTMRKAVAIQAMRRVKSRVSSQKLRHTKTAKQPSVTAFNATTLTELAGHQWNAAAVRYTSGTP